MLSSGVDTQPVPLASSMSAVVQGLYSELSVSVSKELHAEQEPSKIPDVKPGTSSSPVSHGRASPLGWQRTHAESCPEESSETLDYGGKNGWCGLVDPTRDPVAYEIVDREDGPESMEPQVFRDQGDQEQVFRGPCEGAQEDPCQQSTATKEKMGPRQDILLRQSSKGPMCADLPGDPRTNRGNVHNTTGALPEPTEERQGNCAVSRMSKRKEESCDSHPVCKEDDNHPQSSSHCQEKHSSAHDSSLTTGSGDTIKPSEENSKMLFLTPYLSGPKSLENCGFESSRLIKASAEKMHKVDQSKDFTCGEEMTMESSNHSSCHTQASCPCTDRCGSMLNSFTEATEIMFKKNDVKITLDLHGDLINSEDHRKTVVAMTHPEKHFEESSFSLFKVHIEDPEQTTVKSSALNGKISSKDAKSVVCIQRNLGDSLLNKALCSNFLSERKPLQSLMPEDPVSSEHNEISKPKKGTAKLSSPEKPVQTSCDSVSHFSDPNITSEMCVCSPDRAHKIEHECVPHLQVSLSSQDHVTTDSLPCRNREMPSATCRDIQESHHCLENGVNVTPDTQTIPAESKTEAMSPQGDKACGASSFVQTFNIKTSSEGQKEVTGVHSTLSSSVRGAAGSSFVTECQSVPSQDIFSCHCITQDASEKSMCSAFDACEPRRDILKVHNCKVECGNAAQYGNHCFQRPEGFVENSTLLESEPAGREVQSSVLGGTGRSAMAAAVSHSGFLNAATHAETSDEGLVRKKPDQHRDTETYKHSISAYDTQELKQSAHIPSPETLVDQSLSVPSSHFKTMYQAAESLHQKADEVSDCQSNQNSLDRCRCEGEPAREDGSGDYRETFPELSHKPKDLIVSSGSKVPQSCSSLKIKDPKRAFENVPGSEEFTHSMLDAICPDCTDEPTEGVLDTESHSLSGHGTSQDTLACHEALRNSSSLRELNVVFKGTPAWHSELPTAVASVDSPEIQKSREEKVCRSLKDYEMEECPDSAVDHEVKSVVDHEPKIRALDRGSVSLNYIHCEHQRQGGSVIEEQRLEANSEFGKKRTFGLSLKDAVSPGCQDSTRVVHSCLSSQEHSPADAHDERPNRKHHFKPKDGEMLCENVKDCTVLSDMKEGIPMDLSNPSEEDSTCISVDKNVCKTCRSRKNSIDKHLSMTMEIAIKMNKEETKEHQKELLGHIPVGEASEETITREGHDGNSQTHLKCQRLQNVTEVPQNQGTVDCALPKDERTLQKGTYALLEQHTSSKMFSDEMQNKKQPVADQDESIMMGAVTLRKPSKDKKNRQLQRLKSPKEESLCHSLKKDIELCTGTCLPGASWKEHDPSFAGGDRIHGAFVTLSYQQRLLPVKKQPHRTCKRISCQEPVTVRRKINKVRNSDCEKIFSNPIPTKAHRLLSPCTVPAKPLEPETVASSESLCSHIPKPKATLCHSLRSLSCRKPTKESALLNKLSVLASKLTLATKPQKLRYRRYSSSLVPLAKNYKRLRYKKLLDGFSHNAMQLDPYLAATGWNRGSNSRPLALYSLEAVKMSFIDLSNKMPSLLFGIENVPFSFHVKSASGCMAESSRTFPEHCAPSRLALTEASPCAAPSPKWTFSFFLSHGCPGMDTFREDTGLSSQTHTQAPLGDYGGTAIVETRADCSDLGLHTLLALCSPGCYRIWTKRRNFNSSMPIMQRLFLTQFTQGLKGLRAPASIADKVFCSLPYSVGRVLSIWSQHGPSWTFRLPALGSTHSKQQGSLSTPSSHTTIPNVPLPGMEAVHGTNSCYLRLERVFPALVPKSCLVTEPAVSTLLLSASELPVPGFDELDVVSATCPRPQSSPAQQNEAEPEKRPKKVSQIRIRKTIPKPDPNLTPMGLPRPKRLKKKEFSLEEIYTNKNYKSPPASRCLETIFEEPKERNGTLISVSQQKRKRVLEFQDFTVPRKRRARGKVKLAGSFTRAQKAALQTQELDALLIQKLMELETFFAKEEEQEHQPAAENSSGSPF
ncbi:protein PRR14L [Apodemus sylvaticus]|uniref:protein PRR14L n=1 Tax=Apodemus sylvaticus TaxID=10129 RepID=UPI002241E2C6|nr:protein PRR14L [Apodemus sylvaticus]XP_052055536.1 protein PRR14L [Apodemus sylvaticus]